MNTYTKEADRKFHKDLQIRYFPGNTVICFLEPGSDIYRKANWCLSRLLNLSFAYKYSTLPPPSFHMTVFDLIAGNKRVPELLRNRIGPGHLNKNNNRASTNVEEHLNKNNNRASTNVEECSMKKVDEYFEQEVPKIESPERIHMKYQSIYMGDYFTICLEPATSQVSENIAHYRKRISAVTGIPFNADYQFHISIAYQVIHLNKEEKKERDRNLVEIRERLNRNLDTFILPPPGLVFFDTMYAFYKDKELTYRWMKSSR